MSGSIGDDLREGLGAFVQGLDGVREVQRAATLVVVKADAVVEHGSDPNAIEGRPCATSLAQAPSEDGSGQEGWRSRWSA